MTVDTRLEQLYGAIELVSGQGGPNSGKLCVMSFATFLAGEEHSDSPATASPVIRLFSIIVNDEMPAHWRQRLKPFAPRILGTNDGLDQARIELLQAATREEIMPRITADFGGAGTPCIMGMRTRSLPKRAGIPYRRIAYLIEAAMAAYPGAATDVPRAVANLLILCANSVKPRAEQDWYWSKSIELLDGLCDIGADMARPAARADRLAWLEGVAARRERREQRRAAVFGIVGLVWDKLPIS